MLQIQKNHIFVLVLGLTDAFTASVEAASCNNSGGYYTFSGTLNYQRDDATMNVFSDKFGSIGSEVWGLGCFGDPDADRDVYLRLQVNSAPVAGYTDVYPTNIDGIGVRYNFALNSGSLSFCPVQFDDHISNSTRTYTCHILNKDTQGLSMGASLQFVKTKPNVASGAITTIPSVTSSYSLNNQSGQWDLNLIWSGAGSVVVTVQACAINNSSIAVPLDPVLADSFTGAGTTKGDRTFTIDLNCDAGARINASLSGTQSAETANDSILALSGAGMSGVASGIGIQLLYGNTPLKLDNNIVLKTSAGGQEFPPGAFTARYFQTKNNVTAGSANATATLNITYQ